VDLKTAQKKGKLGSQGTKRNRTWKTNFGAAQWGGRGEAEEKKHRQRGFTILQRAARRGGFSEEKLETHIRVPDDNFFPRHLVDKGKGDAGQKKGGNRKTEIK